MALETLNIGDNERVRREKFNAVAEEVDSQGEGKAAKLDTINTQTGTAYTIQASDLGKVVELNNANPVTVTVPNSLVVGFNCILSQTGAGLVTVAAGAGATVNAVDGLKSPGQWGEMSLRVRANAGSAALAVLAGGVA